MLNNSLIEQDSLEIDRIFQEISKEGRKEKNARVPLNDLFYWWSRKPLSVSRASVILSILSKAEDAKQLLKLNLEKRSLFYPIEEKNIKKLLPEINSIKILDPFAGSGNLIFESSRLGINCHASDYNPMAYLILN